MQEHFSFREMFLFPFPARTCGGIVPCLLIRKSFMPRGGFAEAADSNHFEIQEVKHGLRFRK
jgi:hypothetical protein